MGAAERALLDMKIASCDELLFCAGASPLPEETCLHSI